MDASRRRVLITGVSGLIGRILFAHLSKTSDVIGLDQHLNPSPRYHLENHVDVELTELPVDRFFRCDVTDRSRLHEIIREQNVRIVIHLAAVLESDTNPSKIRHVNLQGTKNILEAPGLDRVIVASSVRTMFGYLSRQSNAENPVRQLTVRDDPPVPDHGSESMFAYSQSKIDGEEMCRALSEGRSVIVVRFGWVNIRDESGETWYRTVWLSHRDLCAFIDRCLDATPNDLSGIYFAVSNNHRGWLDLNAAKNDLHYIPVDGAAELSGLPCEEY